MFAKIAFPHIKELVDLAHELKALVPLHICGKTEKIVRKKTDIGSDVPFEHIQAMLDVARSYGLYEYKAGE